ncbi:retinol dehydrogenase 13-like [Plodia interpunctella]|uniref:retinol dehydrogenase 13-like n=1 Tax=Plodia interpunctella TaxID=58824 RepID=UPI002367A7DB|nr:retinol dehydrogenase 13-like [Plodia interpunctella]
MWCFSIIILIILVALVCNKKRYHKCDSQRRLDGKTALITGGTAGMGLEIATDLAARGARVVVACPFVEEGLHAEKTIIAATANNNVKFLLLDLASLKSVRSFAAEINKSESRLDILVNNAGIGKAAEKLTEDGMNLVMQVNYYGHFLLTILLLPLMKKTGTSEDPARIINTTSMLHYFGHYNVTRQSDKESFQLKKHYYGTSKLCTALFSRELTRILGSSKVVVNTVDPGIVGTGIFYSLGGVAGLLAKFLFLSIFKSPWEGAQTAIYLAVDEEAGKVSGKLFRNGEVVRNSAAIANSETAKQLWDDSVRMVKLSDSEMLEWLS